MSSMCQMFLEHMFVSVLMPAAAEDVDNGSIKENYIRPGSVRFLLQWGRTISLTRVGHFQKSVSLYYYLVVTEVIRHGI